MTVKEFMLASVLSVLLSASAMAGVIDRVAAFVGDEAVTLREFEESYKKSSAIDPNVSRAEVLNTLINRVLLLGEARKLRMEGKDDDEVLNEYIDLKVRAFIRIDEKQIEGFYTESKAEFKGAKLPEVRDKIEAYLREKEVNQSLKRHLEKLRAGAFIKIVYMPQ